MMRKFITRAQKTAALAAVFLSLPLQAADIAARPGDDLQALIDRSAAGDRLLLEAGDYPGVLRVDKSIALIGAQDGQSRILGNEKDHVIHVSAENVEIAHLTLAGSGKKLKDMHSAVFLDQSAHHAHIHHNHLDNNLFGVYIWGPNAALVEHNRIISSNTPRMANRGNGVSLWRSPGSIVRHNTISGGRDGIFTNVSTNNLFQHNHFHDLRFAVHYMYTEDSEVSHNRAENVKSAYVIMFSNRITVSHNRADNSEEHGVMLNAVNDSHVHDNRVRHVNKATFIYNANNNHIHHNRFADSQIGIHLTAGSDHNRIYDNAFIHNQSQVMYAGTREMEWADGGRGNYWSDHSAFDLNGDGIADTPYKPNNLMDQVLWRAPSAKLLLNSPASQLLKYAQQQFPGLLPGGVSDPYPLMRPPILDDETKTL